MKKDYKLNKPDAFNWGILIILSIYTLSMFILFVWGISTSLKTVDEFSIAHNTVFLPQGAPWEWAWDNFSTVWNNFDIGVNSNGRMIYVNYIWQSWYSVVYSTTSALATTLCTCFTAYLCAKYKYALSNIIYTAVLVMMVVPVIGSTPSMILLLKNLQIYDTWIGNFIMKFNFQGMYFLVFYGVFKGISNEYTEAAKIDGASELAVFARIIFPLVKTTFYTIFLIKFIEYWNDYSTLVLYMPSHPTLAYGIIKMVESTRQNALCWPTYRMAACILMSSPILVLFILFRNKITGNVSMGGVKE